MIGPGLTGAAFNAYAYGFDSGLEGLLVVSIEDSLGNVIVAPTSAGIIEIDVGGPQSVYRWIGTYPVVGEYIIIWEDPQGNQAAEELEAVAALPPASTTPSVGPCHTWVTAQEVADCCGIVQGSANTADLELAAEMASTLLYRLTARKFSGLCLRTIRPCRTGCGCNHGDEGWLWRGTEWMHPTGRACGCGCVSQVTLSGTARAIVEVKVDGAVIAPDLYRLDEFRYLVRLRDPDGSKQHWPRCQALDLPSTDPGTFEVTYLSGVDPPSSAVSAAAALSCELFKACPSGAGDCALPVGVTRIIRQGLVIEKIDSLAMLLRRGATGIVAIDTFIAAYNPTGALQGPMIWSPDSPSHRRMA
jgi:hypothetical protein